MGETISYSIWKNVLVKGLTSKYENIELTAKGNSDFTLEQIKDTAHKYLMDDLYVRHKRYIAGLGAAMWEARDSNFTGCYNCSEEGHFKKDSW